MSQRWTLIVCVLALATGCHEPNRSPLLCTIKKKVTTEECSEAYSNYLEPESNPPCAAPPKEKTVPTCKGTEILVGGRRYLFGETWYYIPLQCCRRRYVPAPPPAPAAPDPIERSKGSDQRDSPEEG